MIYARALLTMGAGALDTAVTAAVNGLIAGLDNPPLRELAGLPRATGSSELNDLLDKTIDAFDPDYPVMSRSDAVILAARYYALRYLEGSLTARQLSSWAHSAIGHEGVLDAQPLVLLDDDLDLQDSGATSKPVSADDIVRQFLDSTTETIDRLQLRLQP